jgi:uncharacterized membrane protein YfhO
LVLHFEHPSKSALSPGTFAKKYRYNTSFDSDNDRVVAVAKRAGNDLSRIHRLVDDQNTHYGFVALSIAVSDKKLCLVIDYLFVSQQYRGIRYPELDNKTIAGLLIGYAYQIATEADKNYPVRYMALVPANDKLETYYAALGFCKLDSTDFMYLKL